MKTKFETDSTGRVTIYYDDNWSHGERLERCFSCPPDGGYVVELLPNGNSRQVCDMLASTGPTLTASSRETLIDVIRREYRRMRGWERRNP